MQNTTSYNINELNNTANSRYCNTIMDNTQMKEICKSLYFLSDLQEQKRLWIDLNSNDEISSFDEEMQYLYYNLQFADFILENKHFWDISFLNKMIAF